MFSSDIAKTHHSPSSKYYKFHVFKIGKAIFCNGCFANAIFLFCILPILTVLTITINGAYFEIKSDIQIIGALITLPLFLLIFEILTGKMILQTFNSIYRIFYALLMHSYILFSPYTLTITPEFLFILILILGLPQILVYGYKIGTRNEFKHSKLKVFIRLLFVTAYFLSLLFIRINVISGLFLILSCAILFLRLRQFSVYRVEAKESKLVIRSAIDLTNPSILSNIIKKLGIFDENGILIFHSRRGELSASDLLKTIVRIFLILLAIMIGIVIIISIAWCSPNRSCPDCRCPCPDCRCDCPDCGECCSGCDCGC